MSIRFLDLPASIRVQIYHYTLGSKAIHILCNGEDSSDPSPGCTYLMCSSPLISVPSLLPEDLEPELEKSELARPMWAPSCSYQHPEVTEARSEFLDLGVLRTCKHVYAEARGVLYGENYFAFLARDDFTEFLVTSPAASMRAEAITKMAFLVDPKTPQTHFLNKMLGELYLPHGVMSAPSSHFPALTALSFLVGLSEPQRPGWSEWEKWSNIFWLWGFMYFGIEELEYLSVRVDEKYVVWEEGSGDEEGRFRAPNEEEITHFKDGLSGWLLRGWMGGDQDDVEDWHGRYEMRTREIDFADEEVEGEE